MDVHSHPKKEAEAVPVAEFAITVLEGCYEQIPNSDESCNNKIRNNNAPAL